MGQTQISVWEFLEPTQNGEILREIILVHRLPRLFTAILTGISLPLSGWILQEYFRNPLAGPSVLGVTSFAGLGVALVIVGGVLFGFYGWNNNPLILIISAVLGGLFAIFILTGIARKIKSSSALIIIGFMFSALAGAIISILQFYAENQSLKSYIVWNFGSLNGLNYEQVLYYFISVIIGFVLIRKIVPNLEKMQLGEVYAQSMGVDLKSLRTQIVLISSLLVSVSTALIGPIAFIGLAIPHICRSYLKTSNFKKLFYMVVLLGANLLVLFSIIAEIFPMGVLPINIISALFGVPIVLSIVWKQKTFW